MNYLLLKCPVLLDHYNSWQNSEDDKTGIDVADAPGQLLDASVSWEANDSITLYLDTRWIMDRKRSAIDTRNNIDNYNGTNFSLTYHVSEELDTQLTVRNIFDSNALEASDGQIVEDYPLEKRGVWLSVNYSL